MATVKGSPGPNAQANGPWRIKFKPGYGWDAIAAGHYRCKDGQEFAHWRDARTMCDRINTLATKIESAAKKCIVEQTTGWRYCLRCKASSHASAVVCSKCQHPIRLQPQSK